ncbi:MAG: V-type ATPase 116kDa subunit family protein [Candidatus Caldarchaeum sp.]
MGLSKVLGVAVIAPRHRSEELVRDLMRFEDFHPVEKTKYRDPLLHEIEYRADLGYSTVQALILELNIKESVGIIEQLSKPVEIEAKKFSASDLLSLLDKLEAESRPVVEAVNKLLNRRKEAQEKLNQTTTLFNSLRALKDLNISLDQFTGLRWFHIFITTASASELSELRRALSKSAVITQPLENINLVVIVSKRSDGEDVERVVKGLGLKPLTIPSGYPKTVSEAVARLETEVQSLKKEVDALGSELTELLERERLRLIAARDGYQLVKDTLSRIAGAGELRSFAVAEGYIPAEKKDEFLKTIGSKYHVVFKEEPHGHHEEQPVLLRNSSPVKPFENVTLIQGAPKSGEIDPTPFVSIFFTIFYGLMFADLGHGLVILGFGAFMYKRVRGALREWAKLLMFLGISAAIMGFLLGEAFGFKVGKLISSPELIHLVEEHGETKQFSLVEVQKMLVFTIFLGVVHMVVGYILSIVKLIKEKELAEAFTVKLPTLLMYIFGIFFALAFFGAGGNIQGILSTESPAPLVNLPTNLVGAVGIYGAVACIIVLMLGRFVAGLAGLGHKTGIVSSIGMGLLEVLENIIHFLSNTISYSRITILLIVHVALLLLLNTAWEALGPVSLPLLIVGNAGVIVLEGLLVFIQAMRLHVYEFFSKFYDGTGTPFRKLSRQTIYAKISFE